MTERRINFEHRFAAHLASRGAPVLIPLPVAGDETWFRVGEILCEVYPFVEGRYGRPVEGEASLSGSLLGSFHRCGEDFDRSLYEAPVVQNQLDPRELETRLDALRRFAHGEEMGGARFAGDASLFDTLWARWERIRMTYPPAGSLPGVLRHGDFHLWNVLFSESEPARILTLLDLDMVAEGAPIYDVSYALYFLLAATAWRHGPYAAAGEPAPWEPVCQEFVRGYSEVTRVPITDGEVRVMPLQMECIAIHFLSYNILKQPDSESAAAFLKAEYLDIADWLEAHQRELVEVTREAAR